MIEVLNICRKKNTSKIGYNCAKNDKIFYFNYKISLILTGY